MQSLTLQEFFEHVHSSQLLAAQLEYYSNDGQPLRDFLMANISEWLSSREFKDMVDGERYYGNENPAIMSRERKVIGRNGEMVRAPYLANNKLPHPYLRKLTKQKIGYLLSKPFTVTSSNETFQEALAEYFDKDFYRLIKNVGKDAIVSGKAWIQPYYDPKGNLKFKRIPPQEVMPFWEDIDHTDLGAAMRIYEVVVYAGTEKTTVQHVKFFTPEKIYNFIKEDDGLHPDKDAPFEYNFTAQVPGEAVVNPETGEEEIPMVDHGVMWDRIPLVCFKYNAEETSLLKFVKPLIDDYDRRTSDLSNVLEDEPDKIKVVRNYDGTDKGEFIYNLSRYRTLFLRGDGDVSSLDTSISTDALENHLTRTRRDIFEAGSGVDTQNKDLGNASGVALKFVYSDLDSDCQDFGAELAAALEQLIWFIKQDILLKTGQNFVDEDVDIIFNTDITINESETISNIKNSVGIVSNKTLLEQHPYVTDASLEEQRLQEEQQQALEAVEQELAIQQAATAASPAGSSAPPAASRSGM